MWLVWLGVLLLVLKLAGVAVLATWSWWWIALPFIAAFIWFQIDERFGLSRKQAMDQVEQARRARIRHALDPKTHIRARK